MTRLLFRFCLAASAVGVLLAALAGESLAAPAGPEKVLGMNVEGDSLSAKDRADLLKVLQSKLERYPSVTLIQPPAGELTDEMIDLECVDIDTSCLARLGVKYGADKVFYTQIDKTKRGLSLLVRVVDAGAAKMLRDHTKRVRKLAGLAPALDGQIEAVFGKPPAVITTGKIEIWASPDQAKIFIGAEYVGQGSISVDRPVGDYTIRVQQDGYDELVAVVTVAAGETVSKNLILKMASIKDPDPGGGATGGGGGKVTDDDDSDWILWAVIGAVVVGGTIAAVALASNDDTTVDRAPVIFSIDPNNAWRDASVRGGRP